MTTSSLKPLEMKQRDTTRLETDRGVFGADPLQETVDSQSPYQYDLASLKKQHDYILCLARWR
jgi:hypothetical protein